MIKVSDCDAVLCSDCPGSQTKGMTWNRSISPYPQTNNISNLFSMVKANMMMKHYILLWKCYCNIKDQMDIFIRRLQAQSMKYCLLFYSNWNMKPFIDDFLFINDTGAFFLLLKWYLGWVVLGALNLNMWYTPPVQY